MHTLLILSKHADAYRALVERAALPDLQIVSTADPADARSRGRDADLAFGEPSLLRQVIADLPRLAWVQATWAGIEPLLDPALRRDYVLTNARGVFGALMSEYVFGYALAHERLMFRRYASQQAGRWDNTPPGSLRAKQIGLLGVGTIGAALAATAKHFGMRVKGYTRSTERCAEVDAYFHGADLESFAAELDYLVAVMPNTAATRHLVDARFLGWLPPRAVFINPGRGTIVDEPALADALQRGRLAGAVLDVFQQEPLPSDHVLWRTPNVVITGHTAALSFPPDIAPLFIDNYRRLLAGEPLKFQVDFTLEY